ncbi:2-isopropylmalate synthase [Pelomyxa schiedti]|nr:2-isopropylmalate synthase [Pelomyxa schiedti]
MHNEWEPVGLCAMAAKGGVVMVIDNTTSAGGGVYTGRLVNGTRDGSGTCKWMNGSETYDGNWKDGMMHGRGLHTGASGNTYVGEWYQGMADGWGLRRCASGGWYEGLYRDAELKRGTWHDSNGEDVLDGEWVWKERINQYEMQGWGAQRRTITIQGATAIRAVYEGEWCRNQWHGVGTWRSPHGSGDIYHGKFENGKRSGAGSILFGDGGSYVGGWKDDVFHGWGVRLWANGDRYEGQWACGKENGEGTKTWSKDGSSFTGLWESGVSTKGTRKWPNGDKFEGTFARCGDGSGVACRGEGVATLSSSASSILKGTLNNNLFQSGNSDVQHQMGSSLSQCEHHLQIEKLKNELSKEKRDFKAKLEEEMRAAKKEWQKVTERNNQQHTEQLDEMNKKLQQLQDNLQKKQEEEETRATMVGKAHLELKEAFTLTTLFQSQLQKLSPKIALLEESLAKLNQRLEGTTERNQALASTLKELTDLKDTLAKKFDESDDACKKLLGQTLTVGNSEAEIQECARNISTLTRKILDIKSSTTSTSGLENSLTVPPQEENDRILMMKPLPAVDFSEQPQFQLEHTFTPPFQLLIALSDTLAQLQRCQFEECTKLADKHTVLSKELSEQVSIGGTLQKAIEETQRECSELQSEFKGKWKLQRGLEGDETFIGMPGVWSMLSQLLPQAQQAMFDLMVSRHSLEAGASRSVATLPGCTGTVTIAPTSVALNNNSRNSSTACMECDERPPNVQFQPCGHVVLCSQCAAFMKKCPDCRAFIKYKINL